VVSCLERLAADRGAPAYAVADRCRFNGTDAVFIDPSSRWQNGWVESINGRLRDEYLNSQRFNSLLEAKVLLEDRRIAYNINRPQQRARLDHPGRVRRGLAPPTTAHTRVAGGSTIGVPSPAHHGHQRRLRWRRSRLDRST
jgi:putative transposase